MAFIYILFHMLVLVILHSGLYGIFVQYFLVKHIPYQGHIFSFIESTPRYQ